jgi:hypothetical protein
MPYSDPLQLAALLAADPYFAVDAKGVLDPSRAGSSRSAAAAAAAAAGTEVKLLVAKIKDTMLS